MDPIKELSFGEKAVGLTFNPGGSEEVNSIKSLFAQTIDKLNQLREEEKTKGLDANGEKIRLYSVAITEAQGAQMWGVKAVTWKN